MAAFKDNTNRDWVLALDAPTIRAVRSECAGLDLVSLDGSGFNRIAADPCLLVDALWILCRKQAQATNISQEQFAAVLVGDSIERATAAMLESIADFFPQQKRELVTALVAKQQKLTEIGTLRVMEKLNDPELEKAVLDQIDRQFADNLRRLMRSNSVTSSPDSAESPPPD